MTGIVLELQGDALDPSVKVTDLIRKALVVARKLEIVEFDSWIASEMNGKFEEDLPNNQREYRTVHGEMRAYNPGHGWIPTRATDPSWLEKYSQRFVGEPISKLEDLCQNSEHSLYMPYPPRIEAAMIQASNTDYRPALFVSTSEIRRILEAVRGVILEWTLQLEKENILGTGLSFSTEEKTRAAATSFIIENYIGNVSDSQVQQSTRDSVQIQKSEIDIKLVSEFVNKLKEAKDKFAIPASTMDELDADIATIEHQITSPKPKLGIIRQCLDPIKRMLEGVSSAATVELLKEFAGLF